MVTVRTHSIKATGGNYATIALWEADTDNDIVTSDEVFIGEVYNETYDEAVVISGATTDATHYRELRAASGEAHNGTLSGGGATLKRTASAGHIVTLNESWCRVTRLLINQDDAYNSTECIRVGGNSQNCEGAIIDGCLCCITAITDGDNQDGIYGGTYAVGTATNPVTVQNCIIISGVTTDARAGWHAQNSSGSNHQHWHIFNTCVAGFASADVASKGFMWRSTGSRRVYAKIVNCWAEDNTIDFGPGDGTEELYDTTGSATNFCEDTIPTGGPAGTSGYAITENPTPGAGDWIICTDITGHEDLSLQDVAANDMLGAGTGPSADAEIPALDIFGNARSGATCDVGPFEVSGGAPAVRNRIHVS